MTQSRGDSVWTRELVPGHMTGLISIAALLPFLAGVLTLTGSASYWPSWGLPMLWTVIVVVIAIVIAVGISMGRSERARYLQVGGPVLSWQAAEHMAAAHMRAYGFSDARTTPAGADGGLDVVSRWGCAQVKFFSAPVGRPDVQKLKGASHGRERALFYALSGYTPAAVQWADQAGVALFQFDQRGYVWAVNNLARAYKKPEAVVPEPERPVQQRHEEPWTTSLPW